jgi:IS30 family transposase
MEEWVEKYVPVTEKNKDEIIKKLKSWVSCEEIANLYWLNKSTIKKAIKRWNITV